MQRCPPALVAESGGRCNFRFPDPDGIFNYNSVTAFGMFMLKSSSKLVYLGNLYPQELVMLKQQLLPGFPEGAQKVGAALYILKKDGIVTYFVGGDNYFSHPQGDKQSMRFAFASLMENGHVRACDLQNPPEPSSPHCDELAASIPNRRSRFVLSSTGSCQATSHDL